MSSGKAREIPKGNVTRNSTGGSGTNKSGNRSTSKGDIKSDKADLNPRIQATPEQMQIARIIESHRSEDPELQKKIRQIIEITGSSLDEASMALHSRDNNVEDAITLLTEGGTESLELEWEQAGKKKKVKAAAQKADAAKEGGQRKENGPAGRDRSEKRVGDRGERPGDREWNNADQQGGDGSSTFDSRRGVGRGRGRGESRGNRGGGRGGLRIENNKENNDESGDRGFGKFSNGPVRGAGRGRGGGRGGFRGGDRDRDSSRTFASRARGPREGDDFSHHTIDVWENSQADAKAEPALKVDQWGEFPSAEDWDNEEYTGSLAESKVFVASTQPQSSGTVNTAPISTTTSANGESHLPTDSTTNGIPGGPTNHLGPGSNVVPGQSIDLGMLLSKPAPAPAPVVNPGANLLASIQSSYSSAAQQIPTNPQQLRPKVPSQNASTGRPAQRGPTSSKIPSTGVEMPDDSVAKLDVQFGGLDFGTTGTGFNSVVQHGLPKVGGGGDMMYSSVAQQQQSNLVENYTGGEKEMVQNKVVPPQDSASSFQSQRNSTQPQPPQQQPPTSHISDPLAVPLTPPSNMDPSQLGGLSSVQSQNQQKPSLTQSPQAQQQSAYTSSGNTGSAFVTYNTKPAPGFPAPGFPPGISQPQQTGAGYNALPTGQVYGSQPSMIMTQHQQTPSPYGMGLSTYGTLPIVSASVQPSQGIPNHNLNSAYGVPAGIPNPYQSATTIPNSVGYSSGSTYNNPYQKINQMSTPGQLQGVKDTVTETGSVNSNASAPPPSGQIGSSSGMPGNVSSTASKMSSNAGGSGVTGGAAGSKLQTGSGSGAGTTIPPGMMITPQYILNQGMPMYGFQGPTMYGYDENQQVQFLPRLPHPAALAAGYYDANASTFTPGGGGGGRTDGSSLQSYPGSDSRFSRTDSSAASPVPSNLPGQATQQPMYNIPQGGGYYYLGNNGLMHPGAFAQYAPPQMYPTTPMVTPNNPSSGAPHTVSNHQYQNKGVYGNSYVNPYDTAPPAGLSNVTDYKNSYTSGSGVGGQNPSTTGSKGPTAPTTGSSQQATDMSASMYGGGGAGNKAHLNKINNPYDKQQYGVTGTSPYTSMGQQTSTLGGSGMGAPYNVYMPPPPVLPPIMFQDGSSTQQRQGQSKGSKQQYGQQQYWSGN